ncbi:hypothetical protein NDU88_007321 [Pleurodeles waltl]|uniref:Uncharacterized protein n=1 Tax=Pleurodeles waltl TaxID=8319 RepID=A0AAV7U139_PLEWA|nr:hypothetical protein NDU88_007321 [Pleurodeles waltl]
MPSNPLKHRGAEGQVSGFAPFHVQSQSRRRRGEERKRSKKPHREPKRCSGEEDEGEHNGETPREPKRCHEHGRSWSTTKGSGDQHQWHGRLPARIPATLREKHGLSRGHKNMVRYVKQSEGRNMLFPLLPALHQLYIPDLLGAITHKYI